MARGGGPAPPQDTWHGFAALASLSSRGTASSLPQRFPHTHRAPGPRQAGCSPPRALTVLGLCLYSSLSSVCVCTVGTRAVSGCAFPWQQCTWGVGGEYGGTFRLRRSHWSCRGAGGPAGAAPLRGEGRTRPSRLQGCLVLPWPGGPSRGPANTTTGQRGLGTQGPPRTWRLVRPAAASRSRPPGLHQPRAMSCVAPHGSSSSSFHGSSSSFLSLESSNFEKMSFCQIRRDSLWSFLRSVRT